MAFFMLNLYICQLYPQPRKDGKLFIDIGDLHNLLPVVKKMLRGTAVRRRWQKTASNAVQNDKLKQGKGCEDKKPDSMRQEHPPSVQWAVDLHRRLSHKTSKRKYYSDGRVEFDKVLRKLSEISSILERSALLERDFEKDLRTIQVQLQARY